jgi:hypothetical protein
MKRGEGVARRGRPIKSGGGTGLGVASGNRQEGTRGFLEGYFEGATTKGLKDLNGRL